MWRKLLTDKRAFSPEGEGAGGDAASQTSAPEGGAGATDDKGGNAGTTGGADAAPTSVLAGKPGEKPADAAASDGAAKEGADGQVSDDPADKVPEDGKYTYDLPNGVVVDEKVSEQVSAIFKEAGLTQKQAGLVAAKYAEMVQQGAHDQAEVADKTINGWVEQAKADSEIGGQKWDASIQSANGVLSRYGTPELDAVLAASGVGNHPEVIRVFARIGAAMADDTFVPGQATVQERPQEERLYGKTTPSGKRS